MSENFYPITGKITNVEYLYDESIKRFRIFFREDRGAGEIYYGEINDAKISTFYPVIYLKSQHTKNLNTQNKRSYDSLFDMEIAKTMEGIYYAGQEFSHPSRTPLSIEECHAKNNSIWEGYPFLKGQRREKVNIVDGPKLDMDFPVFRPVYDRKKTLSFKSFVDEVAKKEQISQDKRKEYLVNNIHPKYQWLEQWGKMGAKSVKLRYFFLDIEVMINDGMEVEAAYNPITMIQINDSIENKNYIFFMANKEGSYEKEAGVEYMPCASEKEMLIKFVELVKEKKPIALAAWFGNGFDFRYIANRMRYFAINEPDDVFYMKDYYEDGKLKKGDNSKYPALLDEISPYGQVRLKKVNVYNSDVFFFSPIGLYLVDYLELYKKYSYGERPSYSLDAICMDELGEGKVEYKNIGANLDDLYRDDFNTFMKYGVQDVKLLNMLETKIKYLDIGFMQSASMGINLDDVFGTIYPWTHKLYNYWLRKGMATPNVTTPRPGIEFEGGYTYCSRGKKEDINAYDFTSLYPKIIETYNISFETLINEDCYDLHDEKRYLFIKYGLFMDYANDIKDLTGIDLNDVSNLKHFTLEVYKKAFGLENIAKFYLSLGGRGDSKYAFNALKQRIINSFERNPDDIVSKLSKMNKVAGVILSPVGVFFENRLKNSEKALAVLVKNTLAPVNSNIDELEKLSYFVNLHFKNISINFQEYNLERAKLEEGIKTALAGVKKDDGFLKAQINERANQRRLEVVQKHTSYELISSQGIIPNAVSSIFKERKAAQNRMEEYEVALNEIARAKELRKKAKA